MKHSENYEPKSCTSIFEKSENLALVIHKSLSFVLLQKMHLVYFLLNIQPLNYNNLGTSGKPH